MMKIELICFLIEQIFKELVLLNDNINRRRRLNSKFICFALEKIERLSFVLIFMQYRSPHHINYLNLHCLPTSNSNN